MLRHRFIDAGLALGAGCGKRFVPQRGVLTDAANLLNDELRIIAGGDRQGTS